MRKYIKWILQKSISFSSIRLLEKAGQLMRAVRCLDKLVDELARGNRWRKYSIGSAPA